MARRCKNNRISQVLRTEVTLAVGRDTYRDLKSRPPGTAVDFIAECDGHTYDFGTLWRVRSKRALYESLIDGEHVLFVK